MPDHLSRPVMSHSDWHVAYWCLPQSAVSESKRDGVATTERAPLVAIWQARRAVRYQSLVAGAS